MSEGSGMLFLGLVASVVVVGGAFAIPSFMRYQSRADASNNVVVTEIQIRNTDQLVEVEKKKAEVRVAEAHGIAESSAHHLDVVDVQLPPIPRHRGTKGDGPFAQPYAGLHPLRTQWHSAGEECRTDPDRTLEE